MTLKRSSNRLVLLVGIFLAVVAFVLIAVMLQGGSPGSAGPSASSATIKIVVAAKDLPLGSTITADSVTLADVDVTSKPTDSFGNTALVIGKTVRSAVLKGAYITQATVGSGGSVQDIHVPAGYVAIPVQVDQVTGVGTLIKPGDRVDVVVGLTGLDKVPLVVNNHGITAVPRASARPSGSPSVTPGPESLYNPLGLAYNPTTVKTVVEGLQVLGTLLPPVDNNAQQPAASGSTGGTSLNGQQEIVILAATTQQAEAIRYAQIDGTIALLLRSTQDCQAPDGTSTGCPIIPTTGITLRKMVDDFGVLPPQVVEVLEPSPYPSPRPVQQFPSPSPTPSGSPAPSASAKP